MGIDDKKATELFRQYGKRLYNTALRITLSSSEAEEIMQETLIRFLTGGRRPDDEWAWLRRMCINRSIDFLRREKRFVNIDDAFASAEPVLADDNEEVWSGLDGKVFPMVMDLLKAMPDGYRTILTLKNISTTIEALLMRPEQIRPSPSRIFSGGSIKSVQGNVSADVQLH